VSIPSNIAEGQGRQTTSDFLHFLTIAYGSLNELETQTIIAARLQYLPERDKDRVLDTITEVARLLNGLKRSLRSKNTQPH
jgi:four helix bundle protein